MPFKNSDAKKAYDREYKKKNPEIYRKAKAKYKKKNSPTAEERRKWALKSLYGMTSEDYDLLLEQQSKCCAICRSDDPSGFKYFHIDHNHTTGKIRGLLCSKCNTAIGLFGEDIAVMNAALDYLKRHSEEYGE